MNLNQRVTDTLCVRLFLRFILHPSAFILSALSSSMSRRTERVGSAIRQEIMEVVQRDLDDPRLEGTLPSITRIKVAEDLGTADVYLVFMGSPGKQSAALAAMKHARGLLRSRVGKALATRTIPLLRFHIDEAYHKEMEVLDLIRKAEREREQAAAEQAEAVEDEAAVDVKATGVTSSPSDAAT